MLPEKWQKRQGLRGGAIAREHDEGSGYTLRGQADRRDDVAQFVQMERGASARDEGRLL